jgi:NAD(P)-dependent dehydrogenase (short-subunit alcohol dehydrogenase family)
MSNPTFRLDGKVAVITGSSKGLGRAMAIGFAEAGANVVISSRKLDACEAVAQEIRATGRRALAVACHVGRWDDCAQLIERSVEEFGHIDVLVNNAAFQATHERLEDVPDEEWDRTLAINLSAYFHLVKAALPHMGEGGSIIGTTSVNSDTPKPNLAPYDVTKAGVANLSAALAQLLAERGIRVNSVAPGPIWTPLIPSTMPPEQVEQFGSDVPMGRPGQPAEVAPVYVLLASDEASYVSGARIAVTGGKPIL